jgi:hypothetical protein
MEGDTLYPLNVLREKYPDIYVKEVKKYTGREGVLTRKIPILNCLWNDVLHFSPVHPQKVKDALAQAGYTKFDFKFYEVDLAKINPQNILIFTYAHLDMEGVVEEDFIPFDPAYVDSHTEVPEATLAYFTEAVKNGRKPLFFHGIPHILVKDSVNILGLKVISDLV